MNRIQINEKLQFSYDEAHSALCIHEYVASEIEKDDSYWQQVLMTYGTDHVRHIVLSLITPKIQQAYAIIQEDYDEPFGFEFVPNVLGALCY